MTRLLLALALSGMVVGCGSSYKPPILAQPCPEAIEASDEGCEELIFQGPKDSWPFVPEPGHADDGPGLSFVFPDIPQKTTNQ